MVTRENKDNRYNKQSNLTSLFKNSSVEYAHNFIKRLLHLLLETINGYSFIFGLSPLGRIHSAKILKSYQFERYVPNSFKSQQSIISEEKSYMRI